MRLKKSKYPMMLETLPGKRSDGLGPPGQYPLELTQEGEATLVSGVVNKRPTGATHVEIRFEDKTLTIKAIYQPKRQKEAYTGSISLPLDLTEPSYLFPLLEGERPWDDWFYIEFFVRQASDDLKIPQKLEETFDRHLAVLRAIKNGPKVSKLLSGLPEKTRLLALGKQDYSTIQREVETTRKSLLGWTNNPKATVGVIEACGNILRMYEEYLGEKQQRDSRNVPEEITADIARNEEIDRRSRMKEP